MRRKSHSHPEPPHPKAKPASSKHPSKHPGSKHPSGSPAASKPASSRPAPPPSPGASKAGGKSIVPSLSNRPRTETIPVEAEWLEAGDKPLVLSIPYVPQPPGIPRFSSRPRARKAPPPLPPGHRAARPDARVALLAFLRRHRLCVQASVSSSGAPQAAVVGFAVSDDLEIVFDTVSTSRKIRNIRQEARVSLVVGWDAEQTAQIEGTADEPKGAELRRLKTVYFAAWPDGVEREAWKDITYVRVRPLWARLSDFGAHRSIVEWDEGDLKNV